jgi:hypothetical protein
MSNQPYYIRAHIYNRRRDADEEQKKDLSFDVFEDLVRINAKATLVDKVSTPIWDFCTPSTDSSAELIRSLGYDDMEELTL